MMHIKKIIGFVCMICFALVVTAQTSFQRVYPGYFSDVLDRKTEIEQLPDGGFIFGTGGPSLLPDAAVELLRTDQFGDTIWTQHHGRSGVDEYISDIALSSNGDFGIVATMDYWGSPNPAQDDIVIVRLDSLGNILWDLVVDIEGNDAAKSIHVSSDGGFVVNGTANSYSKIFTLKVSSNGTVEWLRTFSFNEAMSTWSGNVIECQNGDFAFIGELQDSSLQRTTVITRLTATGTVVWQKQFQSGSWFGGVALGEFSNGDIVFTCRDDYANWNTKMFSVTRIDSNGSVIWSSVFTMSINFDFFPGDLRVTSSNEVLICGGYLHYSLQHGFIIRVSQYGANLGMTLFDNGQEHWFNSITGTLDGGCVVAGTLDTAQFTNCYVLKTNPAGLSQCDGTVILPYVGAELVTVNPLSSSLDSTYIISQWQPNQYNVRRMIFDLCPVAIAESDLFNIDVAYDSFNSNLTLDNVKIGSSITVHDALGRLALDQLITATHEEIYCGDLANGMYVYSILGENGDQSTGKFIKE